MFNSFNGDVIDVISVIVCKHFKSQTKLGFFGDFSDNQNQWLSHRKYYSIVLIVYKL